MWNNNFASQIFPLKETPFVSLLYALIPVPSIDRFFSEGRVGATRIRLEVSSLPELRLMTEVGWGGAGNR